MWGMSFNHSHIIQSGFIALPSNNVLLLSSSYVSHGLCQHLSILNNFLAYFHHFLLRVMNYWFIFLSKMVLGFLILPSFFSCFFHSFCLSTSPSIHALFSEAFCSPPPLNCSQYCIHHCYLPSRGGICTS